MSLHIESTENALAELKKQRTKTLTAAISVSFLGIALMGLLLYLVHIIVAVPEDPPMVAYATQEGDNPDIDTPEVTQTTQRPSSSSTSAQVKVIAAVATADVAVVNPDKAHHGKRGHPAVRGSRSQIPPLAEKTAERQRLLG